MKMRTPKDMWKLVRMMPSRQITFSAVAGLLALATVAFVIYASIFLARRVNESFSADVKTAPVPSVQFDIDGFERLQLNRQ